MLLVLCNLFSGRTKNPWWGVDEKLVGGWELSGGEFLLVEGGRGGGGAYFQIYKAPPKMSWLK